MNLVDHGKIRPKFGPRFRTVDVVNAHDEFRHACSTSGQESAPGDQKLAGLSRHQVIDAIANLIVSGGYDRSAPNVCFGNGLSFAILV